MAWMADRSFQKVAVIYSNLWLKKFGLSDLTNTIKQFLNHVDDGEKESGFKEFSAFHFSNSYVIAVH